MKIWRRKKKKPVSVCCAVGEVFFFFFFLARLIVTWIHLLVNELQECSSVDSICIWDVFWSRSFFKEIDLKLMFVVATGLCQILGQTPTMCVTEIICGPYVIKSFVSLPPLKKKFAIHLKSSWKSSGHVTTGAASPSSLLLCASFSAGLRGAEMRGRSFSSGHELLGQIFSGGAHQEVQPAAAGSGLHVSCIQTERDSSLNCREALHLHG